MPGIFEMFITFFKIGAFTFGGGWAMIPIMEREFVTNKKWVKKEEFIDIIVLSQSFPGALAINSSTFIGNRLFGAKGALIAIFGVCLPSLIIIMIIAAFFSMFRHNYYVDLAMKGINAAVPALILVAMTSLLKGVQRTRYNYIVAAVSSVLLIGPEFLRLIGSPSYIPSLHPLVVLIAAAVLGIIRYSEAFREAEINRSVTKDAGDKTSGGGI